MSDETWKVRAEKAEADAAAMRVVLEHYERTPGGAYARMALAATDAGKALLAERDALRAEVERLRPISAAPDIVDACKQVLEVLPNATPTQAMARRKVIAALRRALEGGSA